MLGSCTTLTNLVYRGHRTHQRVTGPMHTMLRVWVQAMGIYRTEGTFSPHINLWGNPQLRHLTQIPEAQLWAAKGIVTLKRVIKEGRISSFAELRDTFALPLAMPFHYFQLCHALRAQFRDCITLEPDRIERLLTLRLLDKPLSSLYLNLSDSYAHTSSRTFNRWKADIPEVTTDDWEDCVDS